MLIMFNSILFDCHPSLLDGFIISNCFIILNLIRYKLEAKKPRKINKCSWKVTEFLKFEIL